MTLHAYPNELATFVAARWPDEAEPLPAPNLLLELLSTCYQASLLREEDRPVQFRLLLGPAGALTADAGPPTGLHRLELTRHRSLHPEELRRLSPAADFDRALIGADIDEDEELFIWGLAQSGTRWLHETEGGRDKPPPLPSWLVVQVRGPGHLTVACGDEVLGTLREGVITPPRIDVFRSQWLLEMFADVRGEVARVHRDARRADPATWSNLDPEFVRTLAQNVLRRCLSVMRARRHGATMLFLPPHTDAELLGSSLGVRYEFEDAAPRRRFRELLQTVMRELARGGHDAANSVGWADYIDSESRALAQLDEALFEIGHLFASLSAVDGALVLDRRFEIRGFGAFVSGELPEIVQIELALDVEGERTRSERVLNVGTRHRAVYRVCAAHPGVLGIVVSQDGNVRFVTSRAGDVVCWDQDT
ncbi:MAG: hypothetical protein IPM29_05625 [Planctomycetes bacterium]|nr:hypothetical protein [Planctomycetota bacterium]